MHKVFWDGKVAKCSCKNFEFVGILCRHILSVFIHKDYFEVPSTYWLSRWRRDELQLDETSPSPQEGSISDLTCLNNTIDLVERPPMSKTKGRPKKIQPKGGIELITQVRRCGICKGVGHYSTTCPEREDFGNGNIAPQRAKKKKKIAKENEDLNPIFCLKC